MKFFDIRKKILTMFLMVSIPVIIILIGMSGRLGEEILIELMNQNQGKNMELLSQTLGMWLEERKYEIQSYSNNPIVKNMDWKEIESYFQKEIEKKYSIYNTFFISDKDGNFNDIILQRTGNIKDREYFKEVIKGKTVISNPIIERNIGDKAIVVAAPIKNERGEVIGIMGGDISLKKLNTFIEKLNVNHLNAYSYMVTKSGTIITHPNEMLVTEKPLENQSQIIYGMRKYQSEISIFPKILKSSEGIIKNQLNENDIWYFHEIPNTNGWRIVTVIPHEYFKGPMKKAEKSLLKIGILGVLFAVLLGLNMAKRISKPIVQLNEVFMRGARGDLRVRAKVSSNDEMGMAAQSFNVMMETISHMTYYDPITHLPNLEFFKNQLRAAQSHSMKNGEKFGIMIIGIDKFKNINDTLGHDVGDQLLKKIGKTLKHCISREDVLCRMGGSQFILLLPETDEWKDMIKVAIKILDQGKKPWYVDKNEIYITLSIGIAIYPEDGEDEQSLLKNGDAAMHFIKEKGGNHYGFYSPSMNDQLKEHLYLDRKLRRALENKELFIYYQPKVDIHSGDITGMETLIRWNHPELGMISPDKFIPLAEENNCILSIGKWVLYESCRQNKIWQDQGFKNLTVAVNISAKQFQQKDFVETVSEILRETKLDPKSLELEITEGIAIENVEHTIHVLNQLKEMDIRIALDDFGTGYSSLSYLKKFAIHTLKIDQSFVKDIISMSDQAIVSTIIAMGHSLNLYVVAEGVETKEQLDFLKEQGCHGIQGYLFSPPIPPEKFEELIKNNHFDIE